MKQEILNSLLKTNYQTPENLRNRVKAKYNLYYYVDTVSRELRKLRAKGLVESKPYPNKNGRGTHLRYKLSEKGAE